MLLQSLNLDRACPSFPSSSVFSALFSAAWQCSSKTFFLNRFCPLELPLQVDPLVEKARTDFSAKSERSSRIIGLAWPISFTWLSRPPGTSEG